MQITDFPEKNIIFTKPKEWPEEKECGDLPAYKTDEFILSCWKFDDNEILHALMERRMWFYVWMAVQPPVSLTPVHPFHAPTSEDEPVEFQTARLLERKIDAFLKEQWKDWENEDATIETDRYAMAKILRDFAIALVKTANE